jgi:hypothetical protein
MKKTRIETTKKGYPAYWEAGGGYSNTGWATIIAGPNGEKKTPLYIRRRGPLACAQHALVPAGVGDFIITANHHREDFQVEIFRIAGFEVKGENTYATVEQVNCFSSGEWDAELPVSLEAAVKAAMQKATCYHCREPHYVRD